MPKHRQSIDITRCAGFVGIRESNEMKDESVDYFVGKSVLLIQEDTNKERIRPCIP